MKLLLVAFMMLSIIGCGSFKGDRGPAGETVVVTPTPTPTPSQVETIIAEENEFRSVTALAPLTKGLSCKLYTITGGSRIQASIPGHNTLTGVSQVATFLLTSEINQPNSNVAEGLNVLPIALRGVYKNLILLRCEGVIVVTETSYVSFELSSDDASVLYIAGSKVIDNDNAHGVTTIAGQKFLRKGVHSIRLDFAQTGGGNQALILKMNGSLLNSGIMYH